MGTGDRLEAGVEEASFFAGLERMPERRRRAEMRRRLQREIAVVLGMPAGEFPSPVQGFFDLGLDSLMAVDLTARLEASSDLEFSSTTLFEYPNITELADYLDGIVFSAGPERPGEQKNEVPSGNDGEAGLDAEIAAELSALGEVLSD